MRGERGVEALPGYAQSPCSRYVPVSVDQSDAETLKQIPGVDDDAAAALIAARPFGSNEAFLTKLAELAPGADTALAGQYLATQ